MDAALDFDLLLISLKITACDLLFRSAVISWLEYLWYNLRNWICEAVLDSLDLAVWGWDWRSTWRECWGRPWAHFHWAARGREVQLCDPHPPSLCIGSPPPSPPPVPLKNFLCFRGLRHNTLALGNICLCLPTSLEVPVFQLLTFLFLWQPGAWPLVDRSHPWMSFMVLPPCASSFSF